MSKVKRLCLYTWKNLGSRDIGTILAALRHWQRHLESNDYPDELEIATDAGAYAALSSDEVDILCDALNDAEEA